MREVSVGGQLVLLVRTQGQYHAVGSKCSHYNGSLVKGKGRAILPQLKLTSNFIMHLNIHIHLVCDEVITSSSGAAGALLGDKVRCPLHGACFNVRTGDIEEYPGLDCLPSYKVTDRSHTNYEYHYKMCYCCGRHQLPAVL